MVSNFRIIRLLGKSLVASECRVELDIDIAHNAAPTDAKHRLQAMKIWLEDFVDGSVAYSVRTQVDTTILEEISNNIIMCPDDPHDHLLLILLHSKLTAIGGDAIIINRSSMTDDTGEGFSNSVEGYPDDWLPDIETWMGTRSFWKDPWWSREDSSTMDIKPDEDDDLEVKPELGVDLIQLVSTEAASTPTRENVAEIIKPGFKPRIITQDD